MEYALKQPDSHAKPQDLDFWRAVEEFKDNPNRTKADASQILLGFVQPPAEVSVGGGATVDLDAAQRKSLIRAVNGLDDDATPDRDLFDAAQAAAFRRMEPVFNHQVPSL